MSAEVLTVNDFKSFQNDLNLKFAVLFSLLEKGKNSNRKWIKSSEVKTLLGISHGTLQSLRNSGELPFSRIQGTLYYQLEDVEKILQGNKSA